MIELNEGIGLLTHVNAHSGSDMWTDAQAEEYFRHAVEIGLGVREICVSHETHRARYLSSPFVAARLCDKIPQLRLTLDLSHWILVCERLIGSKAALGCRTSENGAALYEQEVIDLLIDRVQHIHARLGSTQAPQLGSLPGSEAHGGQTDWERECSQYHETIWMQVWKRRKASNAKVFTATPEYGPTPYTPMEPGSGKPLCDTWTQTTAAAARLRTLFKDGSGLCPPA